MSVPYRARTVPGAAFFGSVAPHHFAPLGNGVLPLERHENHRAFGHEGDQLFEEGLAAVDGVETLGLRARQLLHPHGEDAEARFFNH